MGAAPPPSGVLTFLFTDIESLGSETFETARRRGAEMTLEEALSYTERKLRAYNTVADAQPSQ